jgi:hypothetical protein
VGGPAQWRCSWKLPTLNSRAHAGTAVASLHAMRLVPTEKALPDKAIANSLDTSQLAQVLIVDR